MKYFESKKGRVKLEEKPGIRRKEENKKERK